MFLLLLLTAPPSRQGGLQRWSMFLSLSLFFLYGLALLGLGPDHAHSSVVRNPQEARNSVAFRKNITARCLLACLLRVKSTSTGRPGHCPEPSARGSLSLGRHWRGPEYRTISQAAVKNKATAAIANVTCNSCSGQLVLLPTLASCDTACRERIPRLPFNIHQSNGNSN